MPDLFITPGTVAPIAAGTANLQPTVSARGIAGENIAPGQVVYADPVSNNLIRLASGTVQYQAENVVGVSLGSAALNQPVTYATAGDMTLGATGSGSSLISGSVYVLSNNAGKLVSTLDNAAGTGNYTTVIGIGNGTVSGGTINTFRLTLIPAGAPKLG